jgi:Acyl-CoA reductase (LuxC)
VITVTAVFHLLFRPQFFDKLVAWGGDAALRGAKDYLGPGLELVAFDPKTSVSLIGREAFATEDTLADAAEAAARDIMLMNQQACAASRFQYVEGDAADADRFAAALPPRLGVARRLGSAVGNPVPADIRDEVEALRDQETYARVFGGYEGHGLVVRSEEPVDFHPENKVANIVPVADLDDAHFDLCRRRRRPCTSCRVHARRNTPSAASPTSRSRRSAVAGNLRPPPDPVRRGLSVHVCRVEQGGHGGGDESFQVVYFDSRAGAGAVEDQDELPGQ